MNVHIGFKSGIEYDIQCDDLILTFDQTTNKIKGLEFKNPTNAYPHYINVHQIESICQTFSEDEVKHNDEPTEVESTVNPDEIIDADCERVVEEDKPETADSETETAEDKKENNDSND